MGTKKRKGGRVTESPRLRKRAVADDLADQFIAAGWVEATEEDVLAVNAQELPLSTVCTCTPLETSQLITAVANESAAPRQAVAIMLHEGPPFGALVWPGTAA